jgi:hypothetical protein
VSAFHPLQTLANGVDSSSAVHHSAAMCWRPPFLLLLLLASCGSANRQPVVNRVVFPASAAPDMLKQCSRDAPKMDTKAWQPTDADVDAMEAILPRALAGLPQAREVDFSGVLVKWQRQYVGLVRGGRRFIYGNYFPVDNTNELAQWRKHAMRVCDGGARFFGAEFDVAAKRITRIDFNGSAGG